MAIKVGDVIRIKEGVRSSYYEPGTLARVYKIDHEGDPWANFSEMGNPEESFRPTCGGRWCVDPEHCEVVEAAQ